MSAVPRPVVVADPRPVVAAGLVAALAGHPMLRVAPPVSTVPQLTAALASVQPWVVVTSLDGGADLPDLLAGALRTSPRPTDVVVLVGARCAPDAARAAAWPAARVRAVFPATCSLPELAERIARLGPRRSAADGPPPRREAAGPGRPSSASGGALHRGELDRLTRREREVLALLAEGRSTAEIAAELAVSVNTVRAHVNVLLHKLGVHSRLRAVALYTDVAGRTRPGR